MQKVSKEAMDRLKIEATSKMSDSRQGAYQFQNRGASTDGSVGSTTVIGSVMGGGVGQANTQRSIAPMPPIPKGAILG